MILTKNQSTAVSFYVRHLYFVSADVYMLAPELICLSATLFKDIEFCIGWKIDTNDDTLKCEHSLIERRQKSSFPCYMNRIPPETCKPGTKTIFIKTTVFIHVQLLHNVYSNL